MSVESMATLSMAALAFAGASSIYVWLASAARDLVDDKFAVAERPSKPTRGQLQTSGLAHA